MKGGTDRRQAQMGRQTDKQTDTDRQTGLVRESRERWREDKYIYIGIYQMEGQEKGGQLSMEFS